MLRLTEAQRLAYLERGGAKWVKRMIDELRVIPDSQKQNTADNQAKE